MEESHSTRERLTVADVFSTFFFTLAANLVLQDTIERIFVQNLYADINRGVFLVRGENVLLLGEIVRLTPTIFSSSPFYHHPRHFLNATVFFTVAFG